jgi:hypothetical protein
MHKRIAKLTAAVAVFIFLGIYIRPAHANAVYNTKLTQVTLSGNVAWVTTRDNISPVASCGSSAPNIMIFDATTTAGKNLLTLTMAAFLANKTVTVAGSGSCTVGGGPPSETMTFIGINP